MRARALLVLATLQALMVMGCDRLDEVDAERLATACKRVQQAAALASEPSRALHPEHLNRDLLEANEEHSGVWAEIERKRGKFLPESWKCGNYSVDKYIRQ